MLHIPLTVGDLHRGVRARRILDEDGVGLTVLLVTDEVGLFKVRAITYEDPNRPGAAPAREMLADASELMSPFTV